MRSFLKINRPWQGTDAGETWIFSGAEERALSECLDRLDGFRVSDPADRWTAAIVVGVNEGSPVAVKRARGYGIELGPSERAWNIDGALALAELLPERLDDLRQDLVSSFATRKARLGEGRGL